MSSWGKKMSSYLKRSAKTAKKNMSVSRVGVVSHASTRYGLAGLGAGTKPAGKEKSLVQKQIESLIDEIKRLNEKIGLKSTDKKEEAGIREHKKEAALLIDAFDAAEKKQAGKAEKIFDDLNKTLAERKKKNIKSPRLEKYLPVLRGAIQKLKSSDDVKQTAIVPATDPVAATSAAPSGQTASSGLSKFIIPAIIAGVTLMS